MLGMIFSFIRHRVKFITWDRLNSFKVRGGRFEEDATQMPICSNYYERVNRRRKAEHHRLWRTSRHVARFDFATCSFVYSPSQLSIVPALREIAIGSRLRP